MVDLLDISRLMRGCCAKEAKIYEAFASKINEIINYQAPIPLTDGATIIWNIKQGCNAYVTLKGNRILQIDGLTHGDYGSIDITQDVTGNRTITLPSNSIVVDGGAGAVTLSSSAGAKDTLNFKYDADGKIRWTIMTTFT